jgi:hypothetical protein
VTCMTCRLNQAPVITGDGDSGELVAAVSRAGSLPPEKCPSNSKIVAKDGQDDVDGNDDRNFYRYDHPCFLKSVHGLNLAIKRVKMIPAIQIITEPTTVGRSQLCLDIKISKTVALRTHPAMATRWRMDFQRSEGNFGGNRSLSRRCDTELWSSPGTGLPLDPGL